MIRGMYEWLIAAVLAVVGAVHDSRPADIAHEVPPATTPAVWIDPTTGVAVDATPWAPEIGTYPSGDYWGDECIPDERYPGFGTTRVGAMPCTP